jgi:hypothetical protein
VTIDYYPETPMALTSCAASYVSATSEWRIQLSSFISTDPVIQLDALVYWPEAEHAVGEVAGADAQVKETHYDGSDPTESWMRAFFDPSDTAVTLTAAGTIAGQTVSGYIDFAGYAYNSELTP